MDDVQNGSYLRAGAIWAELHRREAFARYQAIKSMLSNHLTRTLYDESRANMLQLISRKIAYKERLLTEFDSAFSDDLHKRLKSAETEVNTLLAFVIAFDNMANFLTNETAELGEHAYQTERESLRLRYQIGTLNKLLDAETERAGAWSDTAFKLADDYIKRQLNPSQFAHA